MKNDLDELVSISKIVECSNEYHVLVHEHLKNYGMTDRLKLMLEMKKYWIEKKIGRE